jgi:hypothetical protein
MNQSERRRKYSTPALDQNIDLFSQSNEKESVFPKKTQYNDSFATCDVNSHS